MGFWIYSLGFRDEGTGYRVRGEGSWGGSLGNGILGLGVWTFRCKYLGLRVQGSGSSV